MDGERIPPSSIRPTGICPMCGVNPAPRVTYGERDQRRYVCDDCAEAGQRRSDETMVEIEAMRAARERKTDD